MLAAVGSGRRVGGEVGVGRGGSGGCEDDVFPG